MHLNATKMLETSCSDCLKIGNVKVTGPNEISVDVTLKHPFSVNLNLTAFDVRGIFISAADTEITTWLDTISSGEDTPRMLYADGYTKLFNPTHYPPSPDEPPALRYYPGKYANGDDLSAETNPFMAFSKDKPRRMFLPGTEETQTIELLVPHWPLEFGYAVDACWANPGKVVTDPEADFPPEANCSEPYMVSITAGEGLDEWKGSAASVNVEVFDRHGSGGYWYTYCGYLANYGSFEHSLDGSTVTPEGSVRFNWTIQNAYSLPAGEYPVLFYTSQYPNSDPVFGQVPFIQFTTLKVAPMKEYAPIVLADAYPKLEPVGYKIQFFDNGTLDPDGDDLVKYEWDWDGDGTYDEEGSDLYHAYAAAGDYQVRLRVTDSDGMVGILDPPLSIRVKDGLGWARTWGETNVDGGYGVAADDYGNSYVTGSYQVGYNEYLPDFDPGPGEDLHSATCAHAAFLVKYDVEGIYQWGLGWSAILDVIGADVAVDNAGNSYVAGDFHSLGDFDPGPGVEERVSKGYSDAYMSKFNSEGEFQWVQTWGGATWDDDASASRVCVSKSGRVYVAGWFDGIIDLDPGPGEDIHTGPTGVSTCFLSAFDSDGNYQWGVVWGPSEAWDMICDSQENVYITGAAGGDCDYDPGPGTDIWSGRAYLTKFSPSGEHLWARAWEPEHNVQGNGVAVDGSGNVYVSGFFYYATDFDPGPGVDEHTAVGLPDAFLSKFDSEGNYQWARNWENNGYDEWSDYTGTCAVDASGDIYVAGAYSATVDFDPGPGVEEKNHFADGDLYLSKFDPQGEFQWVDTWGQSSGLHDVVMDVALGDPPLVYLTGMFDKDADFWPGPEEDWHKVHETLDAFLTRIPLDGVW
jgi:hypothetical protein